MILKKKGFKIAAAAAALALVAGCSADNGDNNGTTDPGGNEDGAYIVVVKLSGVGWFDRMEVGVEDWAAKTGLDARQEGADDASNEKQVALIQSLLAQNPAAITVVPNNPGGLQQVLADARAAGIVVVAHEGVGMGNVDADIEAFDNYAYGATIFENLAQCMGGEGKYAGFVGQLTAQTHVDWVTGGQQLQQAEYPNITNILGDTWVESMEDENQAYERAREIIQANPDIKGFQGSASTDVIGIARAVEEAGRSDDICVMGTSIPNMSRDYIKAGSIDKIFFWDPARAGEAQLALAKILVDGGTITEGTDLGVEGYNSLIKHPDYDNVWLGNASVIVDATNVDNYDF